MSWNMMADHSTTVLAFVDVLPLEVISLLE